MKKRLFYLGRSAMGMSEQSPEETLFGEPIVRNREYVLSFPDTRLRYELLTRRIVY